MFPRLGPNPYLDDLVVQTSHNVAKNVLVDAINDKCANCR